MQGIMLSQHIEQLTSEIEILKNKNRRSLYKINYEISDEEVALLKEYFEKTLHYEVYITKCTRYENSHDVMVSFQ